jgi:Tol biopolymer transport system component
VYDGPARTDLHPRWSRDGKLITFDSIHEGERQIYLVDVGSLCAAH